MRAMDYWIDKYDLFNNLYDLLGIETDIIPIIYGIPTEALSWEIIITTITIVLILSSILDGILTISTLHMSSEAVKGNDPNLKISLSYALSSILRFITAGFAILTFFGIFAGSIVLFSVIMETYSLELGLIGIFLVSIIILIVSYLGSPFAIIMVVEDIGFGQSISKAFVFSRRRLWTYLGLIILIGIIASTISLVPYLGWILTSIPAVIGNLAIIDLYIEYTKDITF
jgi:hypothetical protein